jgi:hypothetical protein
MSAGIKIADLTETSTVEDSSFIPVDTGNVTEKITVQNFNATANSNARAYMEAAQAAAAEAEATINAAEQTVTDIESNIAAAEALIDQANTAVAGAEAAATDASNAATAAQASASRASGIETAAEAAAEAAETAQTAAESARDTAVSASTSATQQATLAGNSATTATTKADEASTSATNAAASETAAETAATNAGTSATAAAGSATSAQSYANDAHGWTDNNGDSGQSTYSATNNAYYWSQLAQQGAGVSSFNGRAGVVTSRSGDYKDTQIPLASVMHIGGGTQQNVAEALQALDNKPSGGVSSFNGRTGAVVPANGDYDATQVNYATGKTVKAKIDEVAGVWTTPVSCLTGDTTVTITDAAIQTTSYIDSVLAQTASGEGVGFKKIEVPTPGQAVVTFSKPLTEATSVVMHVINL